MLHFSILEHPHNRDNKLAFFVSAIWWKWNQMFIKIPVIVSITDSVKCVCYPNSSYSGMVYLTKLPEYFEMNFALDYLQDQSVFVDVGANIGVYSLIAGSRIKDGKIYSFEVADEPLEILNQNIYLNRGQKITKVIKKAVSNKDGYANFRIEKVSELGRLSSNKEVDKNIKKVQTTRLDSFIKNEKLKKIDILKIDVEGGEANVINGLGKYLNKNFVKNIIIELNPNIYSFGGRPEILLSKILDSGYTVFRIDDDYTVHRIKAISRKYINKSVNLICISDNRGIKIANNYIS